MLIEHSPARLAASLTATLAAALAAEERGDRRIAAAYRAGADFLQRQIAGSFADQSAPAKRLSPGPHSFPSPTAMPAPTAQSLAAKPPQMECRGQPLLGAGASPANPSTIDKAA